MRNGVNVIIRKKEKRNSGWRRISTRDRAPDINDGEYK